MYGYTHAMYGSQMLYIDDDRSSSESSSSMNGNCIGFANSKYGSAMLILSCNNNGNIKSKIVKASCNSKSCAIWQAYKLKTCGKSVNL